MVYAVYPTEGKLALGKAIDRFMRDKSKWPGSLARFFDDLPESEKRGNKLTYSALVQWMSEQTGFSMLVEPERHTKYTKLMHRYVALSYKPESSAGDNFVLLTAIALCGAACREDGTCIDNPKELVDLLFSGQTEDD